MSSVTFSYTTVITFCILHANTFIFNICVDFNLRVLPFERLLYICTNEFISITA